MQHITQLINRLPQHNAAKTLDGSSTRQNSGNDSTTAQSSMQMPLPKKTLRLWEVMGEIYGLQWFTEYGDAPNATWIAEIERLAPAELIRGIEQCKRSRSPFVPRLPQFLGYCDDGMTAEQRAFYAQVRDQQVLSLPRPPANPEIKRAEMAKIRALFATPKAPPRSVTPMDAPFEADERENLDYLPIITSTEQQNAEQWQTLQDELEFC